MTKKMAFEDGRAQAITYREFNDPITLPDDARVHAAWVKGFMMYGGSYIDLGKAYHAWIAAKEPK
ncbi:hypothetical protein EBZ38_15795 [bacterium]|nr:hypothetical protein [bacterium]